MKYFVIKNTEIYRYVKNLIVSYARFKKQFRPLKFYFSRCIKYSNPCHFVYC